MENFTTSIEYGIRYIVLVLTTFIWFIFGFIFWIVLLMRSIIGFVFHVFMAAINQSKHSTAEVNDQLKAATAFYPNGFSIIHDVIFNKTDKALSFSEAFNSERLLQELLIVVAFWGSFLLTHFLWNRI